MKIAQIAPNFLNLNENMRYGGIERLIIALKKEYDKLGYENYVLAPDGNNSIGNIITTLPESYWNSIQRNEKFRDATNYLFNNLAHLSKSIEHIKEKDFDIVHDHTGKLFPFKKLINKPLLTTLHGPSEWFWDKELYKEFFKGVFFNAVSLSQARDYSFLNPYYTIYNGLDLKSFPFNNNPNNYLFFFGQITRHKGPHTAIKVAKELEIPLIIAGNISNDPTDLEDKIYFEEEIKPHLKKDQIEYIGELNDDQKKIYYKNAKAFLMPIECNEAFGLVMIESLACGTPVIALNRGAVPEIVNHKVNGYIAENVNDLIRYTSQIDKIERKICRESVINKFDISIISQEYIQVYKDIIRISK